MRAAFLMPLLSLAAPLVAQAPAAAPAPAVDARLRALFHDVDEASLRRNPLSALSRGDFRYADQLGDPYSDAHAAAEKAADEDALRRLAAIDRTALNPVDRIAYDTFAANTRIDLDGYAPDIRRVAKAIPINHFYGLQLSFADLGSGQGIAPFGTAKDYRDQIARARQFPHQIDLIVAGFRYGIGEGILAPRLVVDNMVAQLDKQLGGGIEASPYYAPVKALPDAIPAAERRAVAAAMTASIRRDIFPALGRLRDFLMTEYRPHARDSVGLGQMKGGPAYYRYAIEANTTLRITPEAVHALGLREVARITAEMERERTRTGFAGDLPALFRFMSTSPKFAPASAEALAQGYRRIGATVDAHIPSQFSLVPKTPLRIEPTPAYRAKESAGGEYQEGSADGGRPGVFHYNTFDLPSRFTWGMDTLYLHEAIPGHHFQISLAAENEALPAFMRFGGNTAFVEGWALYAETLWPELGLETDPYQRLGGLNDEMLRAMRLVVDSGLHAKGWSRDQAIAYMTAHSAMGRADVTAEVERYIAIPGQALAYKVGQLTILRKKADAKAALGPRFDPRAFHAQVLDTGALPMSVLERKIDDWIAATRGGVAATRP